MALLTFWYRWTRGTAWFLWARAIFAFIVLPPIVLLLLLVGDMFWNVRSNVCAIQKRAAQGNHEAQRHLGIWYLYGENHNLGLIPQDNQKALYWLGSASRSGYKRAYLPYAKALERNGQYSEAALWRSKAEDDVSMH